MDKIELRDIQSFKDEDKITVSRIENEDIEIILDEVDAAGMKLVTDDDGTPRAVIMSMQVYKSLLKELRPDDYEAKLREINDACADYCLTHAGIDE